MPKNTPAVVCDALPPLPPGPVDMDALQEALRAGASGEEAIAAAIPAPAQPAAEPAPQSEPPADPAPEANPL